MANHWPPKGPGRTYLPDIKLRLRRFPVGQSLCSPDLRHSARILIASHVRRWLISLLAVVVPFTMLLFIIEIGFWELLVFPIYGSDPGSSILEFIENRGADAQENPHPAQRQLPTASAHSFSTLAVRTIMGAAATNQDAPDRRGANQAPLSGAEVDAMLKLEEAFYPVRVHII
jgi:hypothetical protein